MKPLYNRPYAALIVAVAAVGLLRFGPDRPNIFSATLLESGERSEEISTAQLQQILADQSAVVLDARPYDEYAVSHIPGAANVSPKPGVSRALYVSDVAEVGRLLGGDKSAPVVLYCNGPFCGKVKRLSAELLEDGYTNVRRYQLGIPVWRALGGVTQIEPAGLRRILQNDRTAVLIDARDPEAFATGSLDGARNIAQGRLVAGKDSGEVRAAKDDGRLPMDDHNTRIVVFGANGEQARAVAETLTREAFHNVAFFDGTYDRALAAAE